MFAAYLLPAVLLIAAGSTISILWGLRAEGSLFPTGIIVAPAAAFAAAGLLRLEETRQETERLPGSLWLLMGWAGVMVVAFSIDATWLTEQAPLMSLLTLIGGLAAALAYMVSRAGLSKAATVGIVWSDNETALQPTTGSVDEADNLRKSDALTSPDNTCADAGLRICLFGAYSVSRDSAAISNHRSMWRSKTKSLLAALILAGDAGLTRGQLVDALWPIGDEGDGEAEKKSLNSLYSCVSQLRRVLESNGAPSLIEREGTRYRFAPGDNVTVDVWEFERLVEAAEAQRAGCALAEVVASWERAVGLHGELGLLPDEEHLPADFVESERERLRQLWLKGLRWLGRQYAAGGAVEQAVTTWEAVWRAVPLDAEAYQWLARHYRATGQAEQLAALEATRQYSEREIGGIGPV